MNGVRVSTFLLLTAALLGAGCSSDPTVPAEDDDSGECDEVIGESCECDDGEESETICDDGKVTCDCEPVEDDDDQGDDDDEEDASADEDDDDDDEPAKDAGGGARDTGPTARPDSSLPRPTRDAAADTGGGGDMEGPPPVTGGTDPQIPEATGECPEFKNGTVTVMGTSGISMVAGAKKEGTGSLLFYWHGTGTSWGLESSGTFPRSIQSKITAAGGVIFAINGSKKTGGDCSGTGTFGKDDFKIADLVAACAVKNHGINPRRIYTTGCSAGGLQAGCMALNRPQYLAAAVPNSGGSIGFGGSGIMAGKNVPAVMTMYGPAARDMVIIAFEQSSKTLNDTIKRAGGFVVDCNHGGGHCAAPAALYESGWKFMEDHPYGTKPSPYMSGLPSGFHSSCKVH